MGPNPERPFTGRDLSRRERRKADKLAAARAAARARAMPPPNVADRTDPVTGKPVYMPGGLNDPLHNPLRPGAAPLPDTPAGPAVPRPAPVPVVPAPASVAPVPSGQSPLETPSRSLRKAEKTRKRPRDAEPDIPSLAEQAQRQAKTRTVTVLSPAAAGRWLLAGLAILIVVATATAGLLIVSRAVPTQMAVLLVGGSAAGVWAAGRGWARSTAKVKWPALALTSVLLVALGAGVVADPVILDGKVLSSTSKEARSVRLAEQMSADLRTMATYDNLLIAGISDARANVSEYEPARKELVSMSKRWSETTDVPDPAFADVVNHLKTSAYWQSEAMATKLALIEAEDTKLATDLETQRASFTESWLAASQGLTGVGTALGIPITDNEGPHE